MIEIKVDSKQATDDIRLAFRQLTEREFGKAVYFAINETIRRGKSMISKGVKTEYPNLKITKGAINKGLPLKAATQRKWVGQVLISKDKIKFKHWSPVVVGSTSSKEKYLFHGKSVNKGFTRAKRGSGRTHGVSVEIKRGERKLVLNAFIPKKASLNGHVYSRGNYRGNRFVPEENKRTLSTMLGLGLNNTFQSLNQPLVQDVKEDLEREYPRRLTRILKSMTDGTFAKRGAKPKVVGFS